MSQKDKDNLIGYDPLAWMSQEQEAQNLAFASHSPGSEQQTHVKSVESQFDESDLIGVEVLPEDESKIVLRATQNLQNIADLYGRLIRAIENTSGVISIDASAITMIDTATLQLFVALKQEMMRLNRELLFDFPSERFLEAAGLLGILKLLELEAIPAGLF